MLGGGEGTLTHSAHSGTVLSCPLSSLIPCSQVFKVQALLHEYLPCENVQVVF